MSTKKKSDNVFDAMVHDAERLTDDEIENEFREDGEALADIADRVRGTLISAVAEHQTLEFEKKKNRTGKMCD